MAQGIVNAPGNVLIKAREYTDEAAETLQNGIDALEESGVKNPYALTLALNNGNTTYDGSADAEEIWYAPTSGGTAGYELAGNGTTSAPIWKQPSGYVLCTTAAATAAKVSGGNATNFKLITGARVSVKFQYANTAATPTLNINSTGAKTIGLQTAYSTVTTGYANIGSWSAGEIVEFVYNGTYWVAVASSGSWLHAAAGDYIAITDNKHYLNDTEIYEAMTARTRTATYVIAASDSVNKDGADYICDGTADDVQIQAAMDALYGIGGKIVLLEGTYNISTTLTCDKSVVFEGMGDGTIINVTSTGFMSFTGDSNAVFRDMYFSSTSISEGLFRNSSGWDLDLLLDNLYISVTGSGQGAIVYGYGTSYTTVHLHKVKIETVYLDNSSDCASAFYECLIKGGEGCRIDLMCTSDDNGAEIFYCCTGCFSNGRLRSEMYITGSSDDMSFTDSYIYCVSVCNNGASALKGRLSHNKIIVTGACHCGFLIITGNEIKKTGSNQLYLYGRTVSGNVIENYMSGDVTFYPYSSVTGNLSKYTISSTPTGATVANNVVYSSLSISTTEV